MKNCIGKCLVAAPTLKGSMFERSVVYVYEQTDVGVAGLIINHKSNYTTEDLAASKGYSGGAVIDSIYNGGPVNRTAVVLLHSAGWFSANTMPVNRELSVSSDDVMIHKYLQGNTPKQYRFCAGASVWSPAQLQNEFAKGNWLLAQLTTHQIFDYNGLTQWDMALEHAVSETVNQYF